MKCDLKWVGSGFDGTKKNWVLISLSRNDNDASMCVL